MNESTCNIDCLPLFSAERWIVWDNIGKEGFFHAVRNIQAVRGMDCSRDEWVGSWGTEIRNQRREQGPSGNTVSPCLQFLCSCQKLQSPYPYQLLCLSQELQPSSPTPAMITPVPAVVPPSWLLLHLPLFLPWLQPHCWILLLLLSPFGSGSTANFQPGLCSLGDFSSSVSMGEVQEGDRARRGQGPGRGLGVLFLLQGGGHPHSGGGLGMAQGVRPVREWEEHWALFSGGWMPPGAFDNFKSRPPRGTMKIL